MKLWKTSLMIYGLAILGVAVASNSDAPEESTPASGSWDDQLVAVSPPPFSEGIFPCSECHSPDDEVDRTPHVVDFHDTVHFDHDAQNRWCLDCHDAQNRDMLHLADGRLLPFEESYKLCGQCHAQQLKQWKAGDHGRRTGNWNGMKQYLLCASCHDPHSPSFKPLAPLPPPIRQEEIR